ncbi:MAG: hypothetical protein A2Z99_09460 [Treponema sp. GWB1_62_6]|nr:MAG: hypothetical protein A2Y36_16720 [Treponema sp. GWA1_62_8]OHE65100.1 MAG: hypothetical protein A2Z99_09460 [Treponema sp. GWB1_62_6]OHE66343.1 MAG: hypothetical protein A2001_17410 [Treponema sp. GWC1_61_84]OHE76028.1 MAG: hypothetical protein A2413_17485 [Treponema sp. RIFOXYC1_FULL_61_9]HCM26799.1 hypothetical protein [Treponema sp.]
MSPAELALAFAVSLSFVLLFSAAVLLVGEGESLAELPVPPGGDDGASMRAHIACAGPSSTSRIHEYEGIADCRVAVSPYGGDRECRDGCLGYGTCIQVCPLGIVSRGTDGRINVGEECDGCGICVPLCPTGAMKLHPRDTKPRNSCNLRSTASDGQSLCRFVHTSVRVDKNAFQAGDNGLELRDRDDRTAEC